MLAQGGKDMGGIQKHGQT